jgi:NADH-quinone oxidoreductase subunit L
MLENAFLVPLIPALSFLVILLFGKRIKNGQGAHLIGIPALGAAWVLALVTAGEWISRVNAAEGESEGALALVGSIGRTFVGQAGEEGSGHVAKVEPVIETVNWWSNGGIDFSIGTYVDGLTVMMLVVVTSISLLVHIYSSDYVRGDRRYTHYYAFLSLFTAAMLFFVMSENILQMIVGWELVGVCSFVLIGHWWEDKANTNASMKAFLTNRVGDVGLLVGMVTLFWAAGGTSWSIEFINEAALDGTMSSLVLLVAAASLMAAVASKSGQFPLHTWLPDAMAGPTPVSALIHAATMVVAGVYMVARLYPVFYEGLSIEVGGINLVAAMGGITVLIGGALAFAQNDIKKVLAYSTISQLGYMVMALGVGAWTAAIFHLFTHAFFKALLFLGAGSVSHASHHSFDMVKDMGGLRKYMPTTFWTFLIGSAALMGIFPTAGFWSKDEILLAAEEGDYKLFLYVGLAGAFLTAAYMMRTIWYTFFGEFRGTHGEPHESGRKITVPLIILAFAALTAGFVNATAFGLDYFIEFIELPRPNFPALEHPEFSWAAAGIATAVGGTSILLSYLYFWRNLGPHGLTERSRIARFGHQILVNKFYLDWLYNDVIVAAVKGPIAKASYWFNQNVLDGIVNGAGQTATVSGRWVYRYIDQTVVDGAVNGAGNAAEGTGEVLRGTQSGKVQQYGSLLFGSATVLAILFVILI